MVKYNRMSKVNNNFLYDVYNLVRYKYINNIATVFECANKKMYDDKNFCKYK